MYPYDNEGGNSYIHQSNGWDDNGTYHYNYTQPAGSGPEEPKKKKRGAARAVALVLCCALLGGGAGVGGAALYSHFSASASDPAQDNEPGTVLYRNDTDPAPVTVQETSGLKSMTLSEINAAYADACVCINVQAVVRQGRYQYEATGAGSGFIVSEDGYIVTNYHVIDGATAVKVTLNNGESYDARIVGGEEINDVAVLKIDGVSGLKTVVLGDSDDLVVGEQVCTIGNALGTLSFSLTSGAVSATGRSVTMSDGTVINMIQTDCTINSGNSGGPLFDSYGRVVGITSAKYSNNGDSSQASIEGIGFAIPLNDVADIITDFIEHGYVTGRPYMGITAANVTEEHQQTFGWPAGVYVNSVDQGSCAETAGLKVGDIITKLGDTEVASMNELTSAKNRYRAGDTAELTVWRAGEELSLTITFDEQTNEAQSGTQDPTPQETSYYDKGYGYDDGNNGGSFDPWSYFFGW